MHLTAKEVLTEIDTLSEQEKDTLEILLDEKIADELRYRMNLDPKDDISETELFS